MKVVLLAGGFGTRLSEYTKNDTQTNDQYWWQTNAFTYYETVCQIWF